METRPCITATYYGNRQAAGDVLREVFQQYGSFHDKFQQKVQESRSRLAAQIIRLRARVKKSATTHAHREVAAVLSENLIEIERFRSQIIETTQENVMELCLTIAKEVFGEEAARCHSKLERRIAETLALLNNSPAMEINVNPCHLNNLGNIRCTPDTSVLPGCAELVFQSGTVHLDWHEHFDILLQSLGSRE